MLKTLGHLFVSGIFITGGWDAFLKPGGRVTKVSNACLPEPEKAVVLNGAIYEEPGLDWCAAAGLSRKITSCTEIGIFRDV